MEALLRVPSQDEVSRVSDLHLNAADARNVILPGEEAIQTLLRSSRL